MGATLTSVANICKEIYGPRIESQLENETVALKRIEKTAEGTTSEVGGKYVTFPLKVRRNMGLSYRAEGGQLAAAGQQGYQSVRVPLRYGYGRVNMTGQTFELADENFQAFSSALTEEMDGLKDDIAKDTNRIIWGNGLGTLAVTNAAGAATATVSVGTSAADLHWIEIGAVIDIITPDGVTLKSGGRTVVSLLESAGDFVMDAVATWASGDIIVRTGNYGLEPQGFQSLVTASGQLFNLSTATEPKWKSYVDAGVGTLSESRMIATCDQLKTNGGRPSVIFCDLGTRRAYFNLLTTQRRFTGTKTFEGGFQGLAFAYGDEIPIVEDYDAPAGMMWFIRENDFKIYRRRPWYFDDRDGGMWKWVNNFDAYEAFMKQYWEFAVKRRNTQGVMTGITSG